MSFNPFPSVSPKYHHNEKLSASMQSSQVNITPTPLSVGMKNVKVTCSEETRRMQVNYKDLQDYDIFTKKIKSYFPALRNTDFSLSWMDEDDDTIAVDSSVELEEAIEIMQNVIGCVTFKFNVVMTKNIPSEEIIHDGVTCDGCGMKPLKGIRYKCVVRDDYDLCHVCEKKEVQPHPMLKIYNPKQSPRRIVYRPKAEKSQTAQDDDTDRSKFSVGSSKKQHKMKSKIAESNEISENQVTEKLEVKEAIPIVESLNPFDASFKMEDSPSDKVGSNYRFLNVDVGSEQSNEKVENLFQAFLFPKNDYNSNAPNFDMSLLLPPVSIFNMSAPMVETKNETVEVQIESSQIEPIPAAESTVENKITTRITPCQPQMKLLEHVTFPDGTVVQPSIAFHKVWKIKNSGNTVWPDGLEVRTAGGDTLCRLDLAIKVAALVAGEETDVTVELIAPEEPGRYVGFFRLFTQDDELVGPRFSVDISVAETETDWQYVARSISSSSANEASPVTPPPIVEESFKSINIIEEAHEAELQPSAPAIVPNAPQVVQHCDGYATNINYFVSKWKQELQQLREMGFEDLDVILPLLEKNVDLTKSETYHHGMQDVIVGILNTVTYN